MAATDATAAATDQALLPLALVIGGTGLQGVGCVQDLLGSGRFRVRTITRNAKSKVKTIAACCVPPSLPPSHPTDPTHKTQAAQALAAQGVEVCQGTLLDRAFLAQQAMAGVHSLFLATFSDHDGTEVLQGKNLGDAAVAAHVQRVVFSGGERIGVDAMDNKIKIEEYLRTLPLPHIIYLHTAFFYENIATKRGTKRVRIERDPADGRITKYAFSIPLLEDMAIPFISPTDIGRVGATLLLAPPTQIPSGSVVPVAGDVLSPREFVAAVARVTRAQATYTQLSLDFFRRLPIPGAELMYVCPFGVWGWREGWGGLKSGLPIHHLIGRASFLFFAISSTHPPTYFPRVEMYEWYHAGCPGEGHTRDPAATRALCPHVRNVEEWLRTDGVRLLDAMAFEEGWRSRVNDVLMWAVAHVYGAYLRLGKGGGEGKK